MEGSPHWEPEEEPALAAAAQQLYLQALNSCVQGDIPGADAHLSRLGCKWRLSAAVWAAAADLHKQQSPAHMETGGHQGQPSSTVLQHDSPLPPAILSSLQQAFHCSSSDFWEQHNYDDCATPFFSYLIDVAAVAAAGATNALEAAVLFLQQTFKERAKTAAAAAAASTASDAQQLQQALKDTQVLAAAAAAATHVEWWAHTRPAWAPHQLHFDAAEGAFRHGLDSYRLVHPAASSVVYLSGAGGPTAVLEQTPAGACAATDSHPTHPSSASHQRLQQETQQVAADPCCGTAQPPPAKKPKAAEPATAAAVAAAAADTFAVVTAANTTAAESVEGTTHQHHQWQHHHHHHPHHRHDKHSHTLQGHAHRHAGHKQQQQQRAQLGSCAWLIQPALGRMALWPGNLLHGVLPGGTIPFGDQEGLEQQQQQQGWQQRQEGDGDADGDGEARTTLILAWWDADPRQVMLGSRTGQREAAATTTDVAATEGQGECASFPSLGPCMEMATANRKGSSAIPRWLQALCALPTVQLAAAANAATDVTAAGWRPLPACFPAWEQVNTTLQQTAVREATLPAEGQPCAAAAAAAAGAGPTIPVPGCASGAAQRNSPGRSVQGGQSASKACEGAAAAAEEAAAAAAAWDLPASLLQHPFLRRAELPPLRFFLRSSRDIRRAYIPDIAAW